LHELGGNNNTPLYWYYQNHDNVRTAVPASMTERLRWVTDIATIAKLIAHIQIKLLASHSFTDVNFSYKACTVAGSGGTFDVKHHASKNGTSLAFVTNVPAVNYPTFTTYTASVSLGSPSAGDIIDAGVTLYAVGNNPSAIVLAKDIEIYLS
jgi:hypothetical protein